MEQFVGNDAAHALRAITTSSQAAKIDLALSDVVLTDATSRLPFPIEPHQIYSPPRTSMPRWLIQRTQPTFVVAKMGDAYCITLPLFDHYNK